jgi:hypothetical protein
MDPKRFLFAGSISTVTAGRTTLSLNSFPGFPATELSYPALEYQFGRRNQARKVRSVPAAQRIGPKVDNVLRSSDPVMADIVNTVTTARQKKPG